MISREEAIHILEIELKAERFVRKCFDENQNSKISESLGMAIEALQFRTPKKAEITPLRQDVRIGNMTAKAGTRVLARCPKCDTWVMRHHGFCSHCGQAIDWSECDD